MVAVINVLKPWHVMKGGNKKRKKKRRKLPTYLYKVMDRLSREKLRWFYKTTRKKKLCI